jgi:hypothetical protein
MMILPRPKRVHPLGASPGGRVRNLKPESGWSVRYLPGDRWAAVGADGGAAVPRGPGSGWQRRHLILRLSIDGRSGGPHSFSRLRPARAAEGVLRHALLGGCPEDGPCRGYRPLPHFRVAIRLKSAGSRSGLTESGALTPSASSSAPHGPPYTSLWDDHPQPAPVPRHFLQRNPIWGPRGALPANGCGFPRWET